MTTSSAQTFNVPRTLRSSEPGSIVAANASGAPLELTLDPGSAPRGARLDREASGEART